MRAVISQPDRRQGRGRKLQQNPVAAWASKQGVDLLQPDKPTAELAAWLVAEGVAAAFVMAYGHFLPKSLRDAAGCGMVNFHGSILPAYRGASPVETALAQGDAETGVSLMEVVREMDAGGVADVERVRIEARDTGASLRHKIGAAVVPLMRRNLDALLAGQLQFVAQDPDRVSFCRKLRKEDGALDFSLPAARLSARSRAFTPWPGTYFEHGGERIKVGRMEPIAEGAAIPAGPVPAGTVVETSEGLTVATGAGAIRLLELQRPGGRMLPVADFLRAIRSARARCCRVQWRCHWLQAARPCDPAGCCYVGVLAGRNTALLATAAGVRRAGLAGGSVFPHGKAQHE